MVKSGCVKCNRVEGEKIEIEKEVWVSSSTDRDGNPRVIKVRDEEGNEYEMPNPKYRSSNAEGWHWEKIKKIVTTHYNVYTWAG